MEFADATMDLLMLMVPALLSPQLASNAMLELISILNFKNACHALMVALPARPATIALNADLTMLLIQRLDFVLKFAVMEKDTLQNVMMATT